MSKCQLSLGLLGIKITGSSQKCLPEINEVLTL